VHEPVILCDDETDEVFAFASAADAERWVEPEDADDAIFRAWDADGLPLRFERTPDPDRERSRRELLLGSARRVLRPVILVPIDGAPAQPDELRAVLSVALAGGGLGADELAGRPLAELVDEALEKLVAG
jgi:hypothetical protein